MHSLHKDHTHVTQCMMITIYISWLLSDTLPYLLEGVWQGWCDSSTLYGTVLSA